MTISWSEVLSLKLLGASGLIMFAFFGWLGTAGLSFGAVLLLIALLFQLGDYWQTMKREPLFWLSVIAIMFTLLHWMLSITVDQEAVKYAEKYTKGLVYLWLFPLIAWHLQDRMTMIRWMIGLASLGLIIQVLMHTDWENLRLFLERRQDLGLTSVGLGLHSGLALWGLSLMGAFAFNNGKGFMRWMVAIAMLLGMLVLAEALLLSQSRTGWLSILMAIALTLLFYLVREDNDLRVSNYRKWLVPSLILVVIFTGLISTNYKKISTRVTAEGDTYATLLSLDREQIPYSMADSVGRRAHMWLYGYELWQQKPLLGWGVGMSRPLLAMDERLSDADHPHFHNSYLELLVEQGIVGFMLYALAFALLMQGLLRAYSSNAIAKDIFYYLIGAWSMVLIWSLADSRMVHADMRFVLLMLSGMTFSVMLSQDNEPVSN